MMNLELYLEGMTWGELRHLAKISTEADDEVVVFTRDHRSGEVEAISAWYEVPDGT